MKKAKRLLAVLLASMMLFTAAYVPSYATGDWHTPQEASDEKYWFTYEQGATWLLDMLDEMLAEANIMITCEELNALVNFEILGSRVNLFTGDTWLNLDDNIADAGGIKGEVDLRSVDDLIVTLRGVLDCLDGNWIVGLGDGIGLLGDLLDSSKGLNGTGFAVGTRRETAADRAVLEMLLLWISNQKGLISGILAGTFDWGTLLVGMIQDMLNDAFAPVTINTVSGNDGALDFGPFIKDLLYTMLVDSTASAAPAGGTLDQWVQQLLNWAIIDGTGTDAASGGFSMLGAETEGMMPAIGNQPGGVSIGNETITVDRNKDGVTETATMSFYQLVNNVIQGLMGGTLKDMLYDMLADMLEIEITDEFPMGDPAILQDEMFSIILGAVEGLLVSNGAPEITYTDDETKYPAPKLNKLLDWLLVGDTAAGTNPALDTFIKIDYYGFHIQDNFMSLLNDVARLLINLLPSLGLFESSAHLSYTPDQLNESWYVDADYNLVSSLDDTKVTQTYVTYETNEIIYPTEFVTDANGATTPTAYCYLDDKSAVSLIKEDGTGDVNADLIRPNYVITTKMVFANIVKLALNDFIDGCYFPEWTTDIPSVLAYGFAAMAAPVVPENNYYERLDAYHTLTEAGGVSTTITTTDGEVIEALPYTTLKVIPIKDMSGNVVDNRNVTVPTAALDIICSFAAKRLNGVFHFNQDAHKFTTNTSLERFATEFLVWALEQYMPAFVGEYNATTKAFESKSASGENGIFAAVLTNVVNTVYTDFNARTAKDGANWDVVYDLIDNTLFKLLPASWLPEINGSSQLFNEWLFGNLIEFDLQGILGLLSVNTDPSAELNLSVTKVLINIIDRVLALVFNDTAVLISSGAVSDRKGAVMSNNVTTMSTLDELISCQVNGANSTDASLPRIIYNLLSLINEYKIPLLGTILPLVVSSDYERPYDTAYLTAEGRTEATYKIADLENYLSVLSDNINAVEVRTFDNAEDAEAAVDGDAQAIKNADGVRTDVLLSNGTIYGTYSSREEAVAVIEELKNSYISEEVIDETTSVYTLYTRKSYLSSATATAATDDAGAYTEYSDFSFAQLTNRTASNPFVSYDDDYHFFEYEDFGKKGYYYNNEGDAKDGANEYVSGYYSFVENDLVNAYGEWYMYNIESQLKKADLYDANGDGKSVNSTTDSDYVAATDTSAGYPVDGDPSAPEVMYPYYTTNANSFNHMDHSGRGATSTRVKSGFYDTATGTAITGLTSDYFTEGNFEQIALAVEYGKDPENNVALSDEDAESLVRLILGTVEFDITLNGDGAYNGSLQWTNLSGDQLTTIANWLTANGFTYEAVLDEEGNATGEYTIKRPAFKLITSGSMTFGNVDYTVSTDPQMDYSIIAGYIRTGVLGDITYSDEVQIAMTNGYYEYIEALYANRRSLYNTIDEISWRTENAEAGRLATADTTMLKWVMDLTAEDYKSTLTRKRNYIYETDENGNTVFDENGNPKEAKAFTTTSYKKFQEAYDFGLALYDKAEDANILAAGITQSMISEAYFGILEAWQQLVEFTGFADWAQIDSFVEMAESILADPYLNDPNFGVESGITELETALKDALLYTDYTGSLYDTALNSKSKYDSEYQSEIDSAAALLNQAIQNLKYYQIPTLLPDPDGSNVTVQNTKYQDLIQYAHIFGLEEGVGFGDGTLDAEEVMEALGLKVSGMTIDGSGTIVSRTNSSRGSGTNARLDGRYQTYLRFRYYAVLYGDINGDTRIDGTDAAALNLYLSNNEATSAIMGEAKYEAADVTHDGGVDFEDVQGIIDHYTLADPNDDGDPSESRISQDEHSPVSEYTASFVVDGAVVETKSVIVGSCISKIPTVPAKEGYNAVGWMDADGVLLTEKTQMPASDVVYTATYSAITETVAE